MIEVFFSEEIGGDIHIRMLDKILSID